ncbi:hypothetical protein D3C73_1412150 [compost metagenome]
MKTKRLALNFGDKAFGVSTAASFRMNAAHSGAEPELEYPVLPPVQLRNCFNIIVVCVNQRDFDEGVPAACTFGEDRFMLRLVPGSIILSQGAKDAFCGIGVQAFFAQRDNIG